MNLSIPSFIPIPSAEMMAKMSLVLLIIGICLAGTGTLFYFLSRRKGKKATIQIICIVAGLLLIVNHGVQLLLHI